MADCPGATVLAHHDGTFEWGLEWYPEPPDWGSFAESYSGTGEVCGVAMYLTTSLGSSAAPDVYVWSSDGTSPDAVLAMVPEVDLGHVPYWPDFARYEVEIHARVQGQFFVGYWPWNYGGAETYFILTDTEGERGMPRFKVPPGLPHWEEGWIDANEFFPERDNHSLAFEAIIRLDSTPVALSTWGRVKSMFR